MSEENPRPKGELSIRSLAMPADTNPSGDIFGGWILSQMDIAGSIAAGNRAKGRVATVAVKGMSFHLPVRVGDVVCCHTEIQRVGDTSVTILVEVWTMRRGEQRQIKVTEGAFVYVALDEEGRKRPVPPE